MDRFAEVEIFVRIVESGGIGAAARRLGIAKSVVSRRLKDLETRLDGRLVNRTTRHFSLTETGRAYYERASRILYDLDEADQIAAEARGAIKGTLRIAAPMTFGILHLAPAITAFMSENPDIDIDIDLNDRRVDVVEEGFDLAVRIGDLEGSSLIARKLAPIRSVLLAAPSRIAKDGMPHSLSDLEGRAGLRYSATPARRAYGGTDPDGTEHVPQLDIRMVANNGEILVDACAQGQGYLLVPSFIAQRAIEAGQVTVLLPEYRFRLIAAYAIYPPGRHLSLKVRRFVDFLVQRFGGRPYWDDCLVELIPDLSETGP
jgi:DNA-binding transcriptional LysR family regulator